MMQLECASSMVNDMLVADRASTEVIDVFIDLNKGTVYISSELFPFFCMHIVLPFSPFLPGKEKELLS
jgi:hypothetical protein